MNAKTLLDIYRRFGIPSAARTVTREALRITSDATQLISDSIAHQESSSRARTLFGHELSQNERLKNIHKGRRGFVLGNGPSLKKQDITKLRNELVFAANAFWKHPDAAEVQPDYYAFIDSAFFKDKETSIDFFTSLMSTCQPKSFLLPTSQVDFHANIQHILPNKQTHFLALDRSVASIKNRSIDLTDVIMSYPTVIQTCVYAAMYMGCSPIYILGADHDWLAYEGEAGHFYKGTTIKSAPDHSKPTNRRPYLERIDHTRRMWLGHENIQDLALSHGVEVFNATHGGFLDVYPRTSFDELVSGSDN